MLNEFTSSSDLAWGLHWHYFSERMKKSSSKQDISNGPGRVKFFHSHTHGQPFTISTVAHALQLFNKSFIYPSKRITNPFSTIVPPTILHRTTISTLSFWLLLILHHQFTAPFQLSFPSLNWLQPSELFINNYRIRWTLSDSELILIWFRPPVPWHTSACTYLSDVYFAFNTDENHPVWESVCFSWSCSLTLASYHSRKLAFCRCETELWSQSRRERSGLKSNWAKLKQQSHATEQTEPSMHSHQAELSRPSTRFGCFVSHINSRQHAFLHALCVLHACSANQKPAIHRQAGAAWQDTPV